LRLEELEKREVPSFVVSATYPDGGSARSPVLVDVNHDGRLDLVAAVPNLGVSVLLGNGNGVFRTGSMLPDTLRPTSVAVADINGDGNLDLVVANNSGASVRVFTGNGDGQFALIGDFPTGAAPYDVKVADFNGDGKLDIVTSDPLNNTVTVLLNTSPNSSTITFAAPMNFSAGLPPQEPRALAVADFDGDGNPDIAVTDASGFEVSVLLGNGDGTFKPATTWGVMARPVAIAAADVNRDGKPDLVVANYYSNTVSILLSNGDGTFRPTMNFAAGARPDSLVVADVDNVALPSLIVSNPNTNSVSVVLGNGDGTFLPPRFYPVSGLLPDGVAAGELNGDGQADIITTNSTTSDVSVLLNSSAPLFQAPQTLIADAYPDSAALADLNGDGLPDLAVANYKSKDVTVMLGDGTGSFLPGQNFAANDYPKSVTVADLNGDGIPDLVVANANRGQVSVLFGNGDGTFQAPVNISTGLANSESVTVADVDGDRTPDLIVPDGGGFVAVLLGNGNGIFQAPVTYAAGPQPEQVAVAEFNGDAFPDLVVTGSSQTTILLGKGNGTFQPAQTILTGQQLHALAVGDFNGDGLTDVAVIDYSRSTVNVLLGNGNGTFQKAKVYPVALSPYGLAVADVNGDGKPDLLVAGRNNNLSFVTKPGAVSVLLGDGTGNFQPAENIDTGPFPYSISIADINLNNEPDLILANKRSDTISVLQSNPARRLQVAAPSLIIAGKTATVAVTALDDQGRVDSRFNGTVSLTSSDPRFVPPPAYKFTPADMGSHVFRVTLMTGGPQTISASDVRIAGTSNSISVQPAAPNHLVFLQQPIGSIVGAPLQPAVTVELLDSFNNLSTSTASVTMLPGMGSFTPTSTTTVAAVRGIATFSSLAFTAAGSYMLNAISTGLTGASSASFSIDPPTTRIWSGKGPDNLWSDPANWVENVAPTTGDDLFFPDGALRIATGTNDFTGLLVNSMNFTGVSGGYDLVGNSVTLIAGIVANAGSNRIDFISVISGVTTGMTLGGSQTWNAANSTLVMSSPINLNGFTLTLDGVQAPTGNDALTGIISGSGGLIKNGGSSWTISGNNSYLGTTTIIAGTLAINNNNSLGSSTAGTTVMAGGSLQVSNNLVLTEPLMINGDGNNTSAGAINIRDIHGDDRFGPITLNSDSTILSANIGINTMTLPSAVQNNGFDLSIVGGGGYSTILTGNVTGAGHVFNFGSIFSGTGSLTGPLNINQGTLSPGVNGPGTLNSADVTLGIGTTYQPVFSGSGTSESNSELMSSGSVNLAGSNLDLSLLPNFVPDPTKSYVIIQAAGSINGNFNGLPDGAPVTVNGKNFLIRYISASADSLHPSAIVSRSVLFPVPAATTINLFATPNPVLAGQAETFTAIVKSPAAAVAGVSSSVITGTVTFFDRGNFLGSGPVVGGAAVFTTTSLAAGNHSITASFSDPSGTFMASNTNATPVSLAVNRNSVGWQHVLTGNFAGHKTTDIAGMTSDGQWWVAVSTGSAFTNQAWGMPWNPNITWLDVQTGDFNGDGLTDIAGRNAQTGDWYVALSNGSTFTTNVWGAWSPDRPGVVTWADVKVADFTGDVNPVTGDPIMDITGRWAQTGQWWTSVSNGSSFTTSLWTIWGPIAWSDVQVGDFNGDKKADIVGRYAAGGEWWTGISTGSGFTTSLWTRWAPDGPGITWVEVKVGDFNGDGMADITGRWLETGQWWTGISTGSGFITTFWGTWSTKVTWVDVQVGDFNGDGKADITGRWLEGGEWWLGQSTGSAYITSMWDAWSPVVTWVDVGVGDFNGDGLPDLVGRIQTNGQWWAAVSNSTSFTNQLWTTWAV
jgi:autotransporter-associated beta strand protein